MPLLRRDILVDLLQKLVAIPSVNPHLGAGPGCNEMDIAAFVCRWLGEQKIHAAIEEVAPGRPNVYAEIGSGDGPVLCLCSHLDTVGVDDMAISPFDPQVKDGKLHGRGSCDMKGGLAAILSAAAAWQEQKIPGRIILALVCDEEYSSIGADAFVRRHHADACILTEPSDLKLVTAHKGFLWGRIKTPGLSAHGSRWDLGKSAITAMGPVLTTLDAFDKAVLRQRVHPLVGPASMHIGRISGGTGISTYAATCTIELERRTLPGEKMDTVKSELEEIIRSACPEASVDWFFERPPMECDAGAAIVNNVCEAFREVIGRDVETVGWGVWTDAAIFQQAGVPTVNIGPIGFGLHEPVEWVDIDSVMATAEILFEATRRFFAEIPTPSRSPAH